MKTRVPAFLAMTGSLLMIACIMFLPLFNTFLLKTSSYGADNYSSYAMVALLLNLIIKFIPWCLIAVLFVSSIKKQTISSILALVGVLLMLAAPWLNIMVNSLVGGFTVYLANEELPLLVNVGIAMLALLGQGLLSVYFVASFKEHKLSSALALAGILLLLLNSMCIMFQNCVYVFVGFENIYLSDSFLAVIMSQVIPLFIGFAEVFAWVLMVAAFAVRGIWPGRNAQPAN